MSKLITMKNAKTYHIWGSLILGLLAFNLSAQQWQQQYPPFETIQMLDIDMLPTGEGVSTGVPQTLLLTTDFGETWESATIFFLDNDYGWAGMMPGKNH